MSRAPEIVYAPTTDGWRLAMCHWGPEGSQRKRHPVLMVHGLGANRLNLDLDERYSIARAAARRGFDVYVLELRGAGLSRAPHGRDRSRYQWGFGDYDRLDMPAAIDLVLERSGADRLHGLGHSMGGMLFYAHAVAAQDVRLRSIVAVGSPYIRELHLGAVENRLLKVASKLAPRGLQTKVPMRKLLGAAGRFVHLSGKFVDGMLLNTDNMETKVLGRMAKEGIDDVPVKLIVELTDQMANPERSDGPYEYERYLDRVDVPVFAVGGSTDRIAPAASVRAAVARLDTADLRYREMGLRSGDSADYGHIDLLVGRNAPDEVFPLLLDYLEEVD